MQTVLEELHMQSTNSLSHSQPAANLQDNTHDTRLQWSDLVIYTVPFVL